MLCVFVRISRVESSLPQNQVLLVVALSAAVMEADLQRLQANVSCYITSSASGSGRGAERLQAK